MRISSLKPTLVASPDYALLNSWNVHDTHFKRVILELETDDGYTGVAEVWGGALAALESARELVLGRDPFEIEYFRRSLSQRKEFSLLENSESSAAVEIACLDLIGKVINRRVVDLIGGPFREEAPFSAYNFFVMPTPEGPDITTPEALAQEFLDFHRDHGFLTCKFKGGVLEPDKEIEVLQRIRKAMPEARLRIDPLSKGTDRPGSHDLQQREAGDGSVDHDSGFSTQPGRYCSDRTLAATCLGVASVAGSVRRVGPGNRRST